MLHKVRWNHRRLMEIALAVGLVLSVLISCRFAAFADTCDALRNDTLRLHVQANSDSIPDQTLKLKVRDAIVQTAGQLFDGETDKQSAMEIAQNSIGEFQRVAEQVVKENGSDQRVRVYLTNMYFDTTYYENFALPAGRYDALRIELGEHQGHNWFCVLYPGLCLPAAEQKEQKEYPNESEQQLLENSGNYEIRFAAVELVERIAEMTRTKK